MSRKFRWRVIIKRLRNNGVDNQINRRESPEIDSHIVVNWILVKSPKRKTFLTNIELDIHKDENEPQLLSYSTHKTHSKSFIIQNIKLGNLKFL